MAELHESLKYLGPAAWSSVPASGQPLETYLTDLFLHAQTVLDSVPVPSPEDAPLQPRAQAHDQASKASEVTLSSERSNPPPFGHEKFQKEWGKPMKMKAAENPLGLSVYKMSGKDGKGCWFARRSIHEGIGYSKFKRSLQMEFEKSLAEIGPPGTGNVRGIGGEERVEQIKAERGTVEVYRLSAQFPGPTAARDFVTMLVTSDHAMQVDKTKMNDNSAKAPRHYMIVSKPCDHPQTQPRSGFVRGYYESIEFIREVPRKLKSSQSTTNLDSPTNDHHHHKSPHKTHTSSSDPSSLESPAGRQRAATVNVGSLASGNPDPTDPEDNPVEWMMITRSDPGGGIPRFLVERGTPSSICSDAVKFVDWAVLNKEAPDQDPALEAAKPSPERRESYQSWRNRSLVGVEEHAAAQDLASTAENKEQPVPEPVVEPTERQEHEQQQELAPQAQGLLGNAAASLRGYTPQVILNRLPGAGAEGEGVQHHDDLVASTGDTNLLSTDHDDGVSTNSAASFASAEDHWSSEPEEADSGSSAHSPTLVHGSKEHLQHETELKRLDSRKEALHKKFALTQIKHDQARARQAEQVQGQTSKAQEKHEREMKKHEEKYKKELAKVERKQEKERKKMETKMKKHADKDDKSRLTRERDEARQELDLTKKEAESLRQIVADLQKENTALVIKLGKAGIVPHDVEGISRSRANSLNRRDKDKTSEHAVASASASLKSHDTIT